MVHFLLNHGANLHASDHGGWTSLQFSSHNGDVDIVRELLKRGANANTRDNSHWTPLHGASQRGHLDVVRLLLEHAADGGFFIPTTPDLPPLSFRSASSHISLNIVPSMVSRLYSKYSTHSALLRLDPKNGEILDQYPNDYSISAISVVGCTSI